MLWTSLRAWKSSLLAPTVMSRRLQLHHHHHHHQHPQQHWVQPPPETMRWSPDHAFWPECDEGSMPEENTHTPRRIPVAQASDVSCRVPGACGQTTLKIALSQCKRFHRQSSRRSHAATRRDYFTAQRKTAKTRSFVSLFQSTDFTASVKSGYAGSCTLDLLPEEEVLALLPAAAAAAVPFPRALDLPALDDDFPIALARAAALNTDNVRSCAFCKI